MKITLLHPSRSRPEKARATYEYWILQASGKVEIEHILSLDFSDSKNELYTPFGENSKFILNHNTCVVDATNQAVQIATGDVFIYLSDDFKCPKDWDILILNHFQDKWNVPKLLKVDDCLQNFSVAVLTIPIMNRALYKLLGYFWHPEYKSMFVDEHLYWICEKQGWLTLASELKFPHEHCSIGKAERDETYIRSEANWEQGKALFAKHKQEGFLI